MMQIAVCGNVDDGFTSAEVAAADGTIRARVFELDSGWYVEADDLGALRDGAFVEGVLRARDALLPYANRRGGPPPEGLTDAGYSLWLLERHDP